MEHDIEKLAKNYLSRETNPIFLKEVSDLLQAGAENELRERFYTELSFGTGGIRGIIGGGTNRINPYVVARATQGLAEYVLANGGSHPSAVIAHDNRNYSDLFSLEAALVLAGNGIKTYLFSSLRPTPELSFAVRFFEAQTGIMVTASHNPPEYNGYKAYWSDGAQIVPPHDKGIIDKVRSAGQIKKLTREDAEKRGLLVWVDKEVDDAYTASVVESLLRPEVFQKAGGFKAVYSPLHGAGMTLIPQLAQKLGFTLSTVPEQMVADGGFPTVKSPNPEEAGALKMAIEQADREGANLVLATDPDADRIGIAVKRSGEWTLLNGNQLGSLLTEYIFSSLKELGKMPPRPAFVNTIVTSDLQVLIAKKYGAQTFKVLTGFKYIGEKIREWETHHGPKYVFGGEESYGFLYGTKVRDKDAVATAILVLEMTLFYAGQGLNLLDKLDSIYAEFGYFKEILISKNFPGQSGMENMKNIMKRLRQHPPARFEDMETDRVIDYLKGENFPPSDVIQFLLKDGSLVSVRPSGTEPKIKIYASCRGPAGIPLSEGKAEADTKADILRRSLDSVLS